MPEESESKLENQRWRADNTIHGLTCYCEEMPEWAEQWEDEEFDYEGYIAEVRWRNDVLGLDNIERLYQSGKMTAELEEKYRKLKVLLKEREDLIEKLELTPVPIPLDD